MPLEEAGRRGGCLGAAGKARPLRRHVEAPEDPLDPPVDEIPGTHILRLFLAPDDLGVAVALQYLRERLGREGVELLDPDQRDPVVAVLRARLREIEINLARA